MGGHCGRGPVGRCYGRRVTRSARTLRGLALASHPGPTALVTALAVALAVGTGAGLRTVVVVGAAVLAGQLSIGWSNDWIDADRDLATRRSDKPVVTGLASVPGLRRAALLAAAACVPLSFAVGWRGGLVHLAAVAGGWAYNGALKASVWSWAPFAMSFGLLPVFVVLALPGHPRPAGWAVAAAALLGAGAHLANVLPDLEDDHDTGVRGLAHRLGRQRSSVLAPAVLLVAAGVAVLGPAGRPDLPAWLLGTLAGAVAVSAGVVGVTAPRSRLPFTLTMVVAALCCVLLVRAGDQVVVPI